MNRPRTTHWVPTLKTKDLPTLHHVIDTEATLEERHGVYHQTWQVGCAQRLDITDDEKLSAIQGFDQPGDMWQNIDLAAREHKRSCVWAHNLMYDLRISQALRHLTLEGWKMDTISIAKPAAWAAFTQGPSTLMLLDLWTWVPASLERIAGDLRMARLHQHHGDLPLNLALAHCEQDVAITMQAVRLLLRWLIDQQMGPLRPTGSGQSHAVLRSQYLKPKSVLAHADMHLLARERQAMYAGRTEAWRWGKIPDRLWEVDMNLAYARIAANHRLPVAPGDVRYHCTIENVREWSANCCVLSEIEVNTSQPILPVWRDKRVIWPVGRFATVVWDPELTLALNNEVDITIRRCQLYRPGDALSHMCRWLVTSLEADTPPYNPVVMRVLKHWARTVVGRMGLHYRQWERYGWDRRDSIHISFEANDQDSGWHERMHVAGDIFELGELQESRSSVPSIPGWVMSQCRANLWRLAQIAGENNVFYLDTDCLWVNSAGLRNLQNTSLPTSECDLRIKTEMRDVTIHGPRVVQIGDDRKLSGVPKRAMHLGGLRFTGEMWQGMQAALEAATPDTVKVSPREWEVQPTDHRRQHLAGGNTQPWEIQDDNLGHTNA